MIFLILSRTYSNRALLRIVWECCACADVVIKYPMGTKRKEREELEEIYVSCSQVTEQKALTRVAVIRCSFIIMPSSLPRVESRLGQWRQAVGKLVFFVLFPQNELQIKLLRPRRSVGYYVWFCVLFVGSSPVSSCDGGFLYLFGMFVCFLFIACKYTDACICCIHV